MGAITVEVCVDNIESLETAIDAGADRIELCSALSAGGLTPTIGMMLYAVEHSSVPVYMMIRPRGGDFLFTQKEVELIDYEIRYARDIGASGVVIGALTKEKTIDYHAVERWVNSAQGMGTTFHRAFDFVEDPNAELDTLIDLGCRRVLTSGLQATAAAGLRCIHDLVQYSAGRISIMPGCGVNQTNAKYILDSTGATEIHLSGKKSKPSPMKRSNRFVAMGNNASHDLFIDVTDYQTIHSLVTQLNPS